MLRCGGGVGWQPHRNQACVVSGESGAGKTVACGFIMKYLAKLSDWRKKEQGIDPSADKAKGDVTSLVAGVSPFLEVSPLDAGSECMMCCMRPVSTSATTSLSMPPTDPIRTYITAEFVVVRCSETFACMYVCV